METVTLLLEEEILEAVNDKAFTEHQGHREAALRDLLDEWVNHRDE